MGQRILKLVVRVSKQCDHNCIICLQHGNHDEVHLDFDKFSQFLTRFKEYAYQNFDLVEIGITGIGDPIFYPQLNEIIELCYDVMDPWQLNLQTSGPANDEEHNKLSSICEMVWRQHFETKRQFPVFAICTTLFDEPEAFARFDRLLSISFPRFDVTFAHRPDVSWSQNCEEKANFHEAIAGRGFRLVQEEVWPGTDMNNALDVFFNRKQAYLSKRSVLLTVSNYIMPVGKALSLLSGYVPTPVELELKNRKPTIYVGEDGNYLSCASSVWGYGDICDESVGLDLILASTRRVADYCHREIACRKQYKERTAHKCHLCALMSKEKETHQRLTKLYGQILASEVAYTKAHKILV